MPQGRRKTPFSGKKKKQQILAKRQIRKLNPHYNSDSDSDKSSQDDNAGNKNNASRNSTVSSEIQKINCQSSSSNQRNKYNRYALQFYKETDKQIKLLKSSAMKPLVYSSKNDLEIGSKYFDGYDFPKRPKWNPGMTKDALERNENRYFTEYITIMEKQHAEDKKILSYFELNLETWRQLWRVLEMCDILLIIVDIRSPTLMFPPSLFDYVTNDLGKNVILVLNKIDLVSASVVVAWKEYFINNFKNIQIVLFTSCPSYNLRRFYQTTSGLTVRRKRGNMRMSVEGAQQVYEASKKIVENAVDLTNWNKKICDEISANSNAKNGNYNLDDDDDDEEELKYDGLSHEEELKYDGLSHEENETYKYEQEYQLYRNGILTIGCVGFPNVGKSSLLNALIGKKVVSVSRTPGHTKHFQTIFLTENVRLCDCPGLVFPSSTPRNFQVLLGSYPIAQLRVPIASVKFLAEHVDLVQALNIKNTMIHDDDYKDGDDWTAFKICEAWATKRGFLTTKASRPDTSRAANNILRMALDGQIVMFFLPLNYNRDEEKWLAHKCIKEVQDIQALGGKLTEIPEETVFDNLGQTDEESDESYIKDSVENINVPIVQNAFALLNTEE